MRIHLAAALAATALTAALPSAADASIAGQAGADGDVIAYAAEPGEQNRVTVSAEGDAVTFQDPGAEIEAGEDCVSTGPHRVTCTSGGNFIVQVLLEDGDDEVATNGAPPAKAFFVDFDGASGDDKLVAGDWPAALDGGVGADDLQGGPGTPFIDGLDVYARDNLDRIPRQAPAHDTITCAAPPETNTTGSGTDVSIDELDQVSGPCGSTSQYFADHVVVRGTPGADSLSSGRGPSRILGLEGDDFLNVDRGDRGYGGPGNDRLVGGGLLVGGDGDDRLDAGVQTGNPARMSGGNGNDFITGSGARNKVDGGSGRDRISTRGGTDQIKALDGERDTIRCGTGRDTVSADKIDSVARDCESVRRGVASGSRAASAKRGVSAARNRHCAQSRAKGSRILRRSKTAVVWTRGTFEDFACIYKVGKVRKLPNEGGGIGYGRLKLAGGFVAYPTFGSAIGDEFDRVYVYDIRAGHPVVVEGSNIVSAIVLKPNGSVAWVQRSLVEDKDESTPRYEVRKVSFAERQGNVLLDRSGGIDPKSLKLTADGASVTWTRDGASQVAPLG